VRINPRLESEARRRWPIRSQNANHEFCPQPRLDGYDRDTVKGPDPALIVDSHMLSLQVSGADIFFDVTTPKFAAQAIKKAAELQWKPLHILNNVSASLRVVLKSAGSPNSHGIISTAYLKDPSDPQWQNDPGFRQWSDFMRKYPPARHEQGVYLWLLRGADAGAGAQAVWRRSHPGECHERGRNIRDLRLDMLLPGVSPMTTRPLSSCS